MSERDPLPSAIKWLPSIEGLLPSREDDAKAPPVVSEWLEQFDRGELTEARKHHVLTLLFRFRSWMQAYLEPRAERLRRERTQSPDQ